MLKMTQNFEAICLYFQGIKVSQHPGLPSLNAGRRSHHSF